ncbi:hypothetical protein H5410_014080 [Solanum commersonii]|uniref:Uncharacterized protein n=1 Tax=Solanum commersonii TaxID=4109 RepID=A0A9J5ZQ00_SOLCO|nr:hypothetical protein H5410_014080 [Solanum commersonii]
MSIMGGGCGRMIKTLDVTNNPAIQRNNLVGMICDVESTNSLGKMGKLFRKIGETRIEVGGVEVVCIKGFSLTAWTKLLGKVERTYLC